MARSARCPSDGRIRPAGGSVPEHWARTITISASRTCLQLADAGRHRDRTMSRRARRGCQVVFRPLCHGYSVPTDFWLDVRDGPVAYAVYSRPLTGEKFLDRTSLSGVHNDTDIMPRRRPAPEDPKTAALRAAGALHPRPDAVQDETFLGHEFFDRRDRVQVKYEMLRRHRVDGRPVTDVAAAFGASRQTFYTTLAAFTTGGIPGLLPRPRGPQRAHKCTDDILDFVRALARRADGRSVGERRASRPAPLRRRRSIRARSLRALARREKKRRPPTRRLMSGPGGDAPRCARAVRSVASRGDRDWDRTGGAAMGWRCF